MFLSGGFFFNVLVPSMEKTAGLKDDDTLLVLAVS